MRAQFLRSSCTTNLIDTAAARSVLLAAAVSWAPDIYNLADAKGNRMLVTTADANRLIADVWFARADFAKDHMDIVEGLVRGILDSVDDLSADEAKKKTAAKAAKAKTRKNASAKSASTKKKQDAAGRASGPVSRESLLELAPIQQLLRRLSNLSMLY